MSDRTWRRVTAEFYVKCHTDGEALRTVHAILDHQDPPETVEVGRYQLVGLDDMPEVKP